MLSIARRLVDPANPHRTQPRRGGSPPSTFRRIDRGMGASAFELPNAIHHLRSRAIRHLRWGRPEGPSSEVGRISIPSGL